MDLDAYQPDFCFGDTSVTVERKGSYPKGFIAKVKFPVMMLLDRLTGDGRRIAAAGFSARTLPLPIMFKDVFTAQGGHDQARLAGSLREVTIDGGVVSGWGYLLDNPAGRDALLALETGSMRGVSADLADVTTVPGTDGITRYEAVRSALGSVTLVPIPAFGEAYAELDMGDDDTEAELPLVASAAVTRTFTPPREWFADPKLSQPTGPMVDGSGRVFGHIALRDSCHVGLPGCERPPLDDDFHEFLNSGGGVLCDNGEFVRTGTIFVGGPHADGHFSGDEAMRFYSSTSYAWADVVVGYDRFGVWCAGAMRPGVGEELAYHARASKMSGDWRPAKAGKRRGKRTLRAILSCNSPGFTNHSFSPEDDTMALVAAGPPPVEHIPLETEPELVLTLAEQDAGGEFIEVKPSMRNGKPVKGYRRRRRSSSDRAKGERARAQIERAKTVGFFGAMIGAFRKYGLTQSDVKQNKKGLQGVTKQKHDALRKALTDVGFQVKAFEDGSATVTAKDGRQFRMDQYPKEG